MARLLVWTRQPPGGMSHVNMAATKNVRVLSDAGEVSEKVCAFIIETANAAIADRAVFTVGVSGMTDTMCDMSDEPRINCS